MLSLIRLDTMPNGIDAIVIKTEDSNFELYYNTKALHVCETVKMINLAGGGYSFKSI